MTDPITEIYALITGLITLLTNVLTIFQFGLALMTSLVGFMATRKLLRFLGYTDYETQLSLIAMVLMFVFIWFYVLESAIVLGLSLVAFYFYGGVIMSFLTALLVVLK